MFSGDGLTLTLEPESDGYRDAAELGEASYPVRCRAAAPDTLQGTFQATPS